MTEANINSDLTWNGELEFERRKKKEDQVRSCSFTVSMYSLLSWHEFLFLFADMSSRPLSCVALLASCKANEGARGAHGQPLGCRNLCEDPPFVGEVGVLLYFSCFVAVVEPAFPMETTPVCTSSFGVRIFFHVCDGYFRVAHYV